MVCRKEDRKAYSTSRIVLGNLGILLWIVLGAGAIGFLDSNLSYVFLFSAVIIVFFVARKILCKTCAYCKKCNSGFGKITELIFGKAELGGIHPRTLLALLIVVYILFAALPIVLLTISISQEYTQSKIALLAFNFLILSYSAATKRKREFMKK